MPSEAAPVTLIMLVEEIGTELRPRGQVGFMSSDVQKSGRASELLRPLTHEVVASILQAAKEGRMLSHAASILDKMDRAALRELGFDRVALVINLAEEVAE